jgi:hypothetical protein
MAPVNPIAPCGTVKLKTAAPLVPVLVTLAELPAAPVVVLPMETVAAVPFKARTAQLLPEPETSVAGSMAVFAARAM